MINYDKIIKKVNANLQNSKKINRNVLTINGNYINSINHMIAKSASIKRG